MTVSPNPDPVPDPLPPSCDEALDKRDELYDERSDERSNMTRLALGALVSWAHTFRFLVIAATLLTAVTAAVILVVWLLPVDVTLGPIQITRNGHN